MKNSNSPSKKSSTKRLEYPFLEIFELYKKDTPISEIVKITGLSNSIITSITDGTTCIPRNKIKQVEKLGFRICCCCKERIVPIKPMDYVQLTRLCLRCWKTCGDGETLHSIKAPSLNM